MGLRVKRRRWRLWGLGTIRLSSSLVEGSARVGKRLNGFRPCECSELEAQAWKDGFLNL